MILMKKGNYLPTHHSHMVLPIEAHCVLYDERPQSYILYSVHLFYSSDNLCFFGYLETLEGNVHIYSSVCKGLSWDVCKGFIRLSSKVSGICKDGKKDSVLEALCFI
jgi:hypothetical protein